MKKIAVIGCRGAGKTTFSKRLGAILNLPVYDLDRELSHLRGQSFSEYQRAIGANDAWIIEGGWEATYELRVSMADTVIWLDYSEEQCNAGMDSRDNHSWDYGKAIHAWFEQVRPLTQQLLKRYATGRNIIILPSRVAADQWLKSLQ